MHPFIQAITDVRSVYRRFVSLGEKNWAAAERHTPQTWPVKLEFLQSGLAHAEAATVYYESALSLLPTVACDSMVSGIYEDVARDEIQKALRSLKVISELRGEDIERLKFEMGTR